MQSSCGSAAGAGGLSASGLPAQVEAAAQVQNLFASGAATSLLNVPLQVWDLSALGLALQVWESSAWGLDAQVKELLALELALQVWESSAWGLDAQVEELSAWGLARQVWELSAWVMAGMPWPPHCLLPSGELLGLDLGKE